MGLTAVAIKAAKGRDKQYKMADSDGLYLLVLPSGQRYWRMNYRYLGKYKTLAFGVWPEVDLAEARAKRDEARRTLASGTDPIEQQKLEKVKAGVAAANTFNAVADEWLAKTEASGYSAVTLKKNRWLLSFARAALGKRPIAEISAHELLAALRKVEARGCYDSAKRVRSTCGQVFRYAIATTRAERDVSADLRGALITAKSTPQPAITTANEVGALLRAIEGFEGEVTTRTALRLAPHVFVRPANLRYAEWREFDFEEAVWTIPPHKMKMREVHYVPLSRQALDIIASISEEASSTYLFPSLRSTKKPMSENTINAALRRMGYAQDEMTGHGFRAMATTLLNGMKKWDRDAIERQMAHLDPDPVRRVYNRGGYWEERVEMMQAWSDYLDELRSGAKIIRAKFGTRKFAS